MTPDCATCAAGPTKRYCAPARCYCAHPVCYAFATYVDMATVALPDAPAPSRNSWKDRDGATWIDKL